jgi:hypothetical protein
LRVESVEVEEEGRKEGRKEERTNPTELAALPSTLASQKSMMWLDEQWLVLSTPNGRF